MAVLGAGGKLVLKREAPESCIVSDKTLNWTSNFYSSICDGYLSGDHVAANCLPVAEPGVLPGNPDGWASYYSSRWFLGPNRDQITSSNDLFYKTDSESYPDGQSGDAAQFYARPGDTSDGNEIPGCITDDYWIHIDELGRVSFYKSRCAALAGCLQDRVSLGNVQGTAVIAPFGSLDYHNAVWECFAGLQTDYGFSDVADSTTLISICNDAPRYQIPVANPNTEEYAYNNANVLPRSANQSAPYWQCVAELREWELNLTAPEVDTTSVAEKFGNAVKSVVSGGGSTEFFIDRTCFDSVNQTNGLTLLQLLLMTDKGCKASAQFYMLQRPGDCGADPCTGLVKGDLYYECDILITQTAVNVRPTELVVGTAQFVTTSDIALREVAPNG